MDAAKLLVLTRRPCTDERCAAPFNASLAYLCLYFVSEIDTSSASAIKQQDGGCGSIDLLHPSGTRRLHTSKSDKLRISTAVCFMLRRRQRHCAD